MGQNEDLEAMRAFIHGWRDAGGEVEVSLYAPEYIKDADAQAQPKDQIEKE